MLAPGFWACTSEGPGFTDGMLSDSPNLDVVGVEIVDRSIKTRAEGDQELPPDYTYDVDTLIPYTLDFNENTVIQVSQKTRNMDPFTTDETTYDFSYIPFSIDDTVEDPWNDPNSYNFGAAVEDDPLEWNKIGENGSWNGGFALFSLYFPQENQLREKPGENGTTVYSVMQDQRDKQNLIKSDILGAYSSTPNLFTRIRFRLFHLMTYLRVRLYVPVYDDQLLTGYHDGALQGASLTNVTPDFAIDWNAVRTPFTMGPAVSPLKGEGEIMMYQHPIPDGLTKYPITEIKYKDFIPDLDGFYDQGLGDKEYDKVRIYDFSVILPPQRGEVGEDGKENNFTSTHFLNFFLKSNSGVTNQYYFTQGQQGNNTVSSLEMNQGIFQYLELYVPRVGNAVVYVKGSVNNWNQLGTEMVLTPELEEE